MLHGIIETQNRVAVADQILHALSEQLSVNEHLRAKLSIISQG
jgi:hypothetical protein